MVEFFTDQIVEKFLSDGTVSDDYNNDYEDGDRYHHESHVDLDYALRDAVSVIEELDEFEETDSGLWEGQDMKQALATCAAYTYGSAVAYYWSKLIAKINDDDQLEQLKEEDPDPSAEKKREGRIRQRLAKIVTSFRGHS
jgi:hypothetical protein